MASVLVWVPDASANPGGNFPGPGLPDYPCVGQSGLVGIVPYYFEDCPTEANGSHRHCEAGGVSASGGAFTATSGLGFGGLGNFGFAFGSCYYKWPDGALAPMPNPPGAWRNFLVPAPIPVQHTAGPMPYDQTQDVAPPPVLAPPPDPNCPDCPAPEATPPPQVLPPPVVAQPTIQPPVLQPNVTEVLPPPPDPTKVGPPVAPGEGIVPMPGQTNPVQGNPLRSENQRTEN